MNIQSLRYFISVTKHLNFTKAAEEFYIAQSAMSQQILRLEKELDVSLFDRSYKNITLTHEGTVFLEDACCIVNRYDRAIAKLKNLKKDCKDVIHIAFNGQYERVFFPDLMSIFLNSYPNIQLKLHFCPLNKIEYELEQGVYDLVIGYPYEFIDNKILQTITLFRDNISLAVNHSHPITQKESIDFMEFKEESILMVQESDSPKNFSRMKQDLQKYGYDPNKIEQVQNFDTMLLMVESGTGIAFVPSSLQANSSLRLKYYPIETDDGIRFTHDVAAIYLKSNDDPKIQSFISIAISFFNNLTTN